MTATAQALPDRPPAPDSPSRPVPPGTHVTIRDLHKAFAGQPLYQGFDLDLAKGRITSIFGPNGCGKSTLISMIAGLVPIDRGSILFEGKTLRETRIGYVFQNYRDALFPWLRARDNIAYPLKIAGQPRAERNARVQELAETFGIGFDLGRYPYELSGGQQQLVSIMRALAPHPEVLFLDEPFSALDYEMTLNIRDTLQAVYDRTRLTMVVVSHDLEEAVYLADEVLLLSKRPTRIAEQVPFAAPRPRDAATLSAAEFVRTKAHCLEVFQREVRR